MKKILITIFTSLATLFSGVEASAELTVAGADLSISAKHPRILATDEDFKVYKETVLKGSNKYLKELHKAYMGVAEASVEKNKTFEYAPNAAGKLLSVSRDVLKEVFACAYAYRFTGTKAYLRRAEKIVTDVCGFETWHPKHYLDVAEMSTAVGLAYDWLYNKMDKKVREKARIALNEYGLNTAEDEKFRGKFRAGNNWGQVLNGGLIVSAMAVYEDNPERAQALIRRAVTDNYEKMPNYYTADGVYPEGGGYWSYGTMFQLLAVEALECAYGTDFGLTDIPGWKNTAYFKISSYGNTGKSYNYSDGSEGKPTYINQLWYFARKVNGPDVLFNNFRFLDSEDAKMGERLGAMFLLDLSKVSVESVKEPEMRVFHGDGKTPIVLARSGWKEGDLFLGAKGGKARVNHGHMDVGSFVYEAYGIRWAKEPKTDGYTVHEVNMPKIDRKKSLWNGNQDSWRWRCPGYNNREHSTLTVNNHDHLVEAYATMDEVFDSKEAKGARFNMTPVFEGDLVKAERTVIIRNDEYLEVTDVLAAPEGRDAEVRWTWTSGMAPQSVGDDGITFRQKKIVMRLATDAPSPKFQTWSTNPADYPENPTSSYLKHESRTDTFLSGFTFTVPAGKEIKVVTTFKKAN